jgi:hypothetical protein
MDLKRIRAESIEAAQRLGIYVPAELPLSDTNLKLRDAEEVVSRILTMNALAAAAYGFDKDRATAWLNRERIIGSLTSDECSYLLHGGKNSDSFKLQIEGMWALAWALGIVNELNFSKDCDNRFVTLFPDLKRDQASSDFRIRMNPRSTESVIGACDLAYCLSWAIRQSELTGESVMRNLKPYVVIERRRALEWLLSDEAWEDVSLDTKTKSLGKSSADTSRNLRAGAR